MLKRITYLSFAAMLLCGATSRAAATDSADGKTKKKPAAVRFLLLSIERPNRYSAPVKGLQSVIATPPSELPPDGLYDKGENDYKNIQVSAQSISDPLIIKSVKEGESHILYEKKMPEGGAGKPVKAADVIWKPSLTFPIVSEEQMVCYYQPALTGDWAPPKMTIVDTTKEKYPDDSAILLNTMKTPVVVQFGPVAKPVVVNPGAYVVVPVTQDESGAVPLKVARALGNGKFAVVANTSRVFEKGTRFIVLLSETNPKLAGRDSDLRIIRFPAAQ